MSHLIANETRKAIVPILRTERRYLGTLASFVAVLRVVPEVSLSTVLLILEEMHEECDIQ